MPRTERARLSTGAFQSAFLTGLAGASGFRAGARPVAGFPPGPSERKGGVWRQRTSLEAWLEYHRATLLMKCGGLEPEQLASRSCLPSTMSLHIDGVTG